jgi:hypothetical protein
MSIDEFWQIVERVHTAAPQDMRAKCKLLAEELHRIPADEILSFGRHFDDCYHKADKWDIWGAAYIIHRGCSDDGFMDFRSTLISLGRQPFEAALTNADSLAGFDINPEWACFEGYQYVPGKVWRERFSCVSPEDEQQTKHHGGTTGEYVDPEEMTPRFPRLVAKYNHKDTDPEVLKAKRARRAKFEEMTEVVRNILLHAVIPKCGLVPPPRIVKQVLAIGKAPGSSGLIYEWEPFDLDEGNFWAALWRLERPSPGDLNPRPDLTGKRIVLDTNCGDVSSYENWIASLETRGAE